MNLFEKGSDSNEDQYLHPNEIMERLMSMFEMVDTSYEDIDQDSSDHRFSFLKNEAYRNGVYEFIRDLTEYADKLGGANIIFLDRAARPIYAGVDEYWNLKHKDEKDYSNKPKFFFVNPRGFKVDGGSFFANRELRFQLIKEFKDKFKYLIDEKDKPAVIVDTCSHTGDSINNVREILDRIGFKDIKVATMNRPDTLSRVRSELKSDYTLPACYPLANYNRGQILGHKNSDSIVSKPAEFGYYDDETSVREDARQLRWELRQVVKDNFSQESDFE